MTCRMPTANACNFVTSGAGQSFGEIALISADSTRNASIIADDDTDLFAIERELFKNTLEVRARASTLTSCQRHMTQWR